MHFFPPSIHKKKGIKDDSNCRLFHTKAVMELPSRETIARSHTVNIVDLMPSLEESTVHRSQSLDDLVRATLVQTAASLPTRVKPGCEPSKTKRFRSDRSLSEYVRMREIYPVDVISDDDLVLLLHGNGCDIVKTTRTLVFLDYIQDAFGEDVRANTLRKKLKRIESQEFVKIDIDIVGTPLHNAVRNALKQRKARNSCKRTAKDDG